MKRLVVELAATLASFAAFAEEPGPLLVADYDRDGKIDVTDRERARAGEALVFWINDDNDEAGDGDTNSDLDDVPGGETRDCDDETVNGRCDLLDFIPVLVELRIHPEWRNLTWKLSSESVNVVFTPLDEDRVGNFHTVEVQDCGPERNQKAHEATVSRLVDGDVEIPGGFLTSGACVLMVEGAALADDGALTIAGYDGDGNRVTETTLKLSVVGVESMYGWMNLREKGRGTREGERAEDRLAPRREDASGTVRDNRHFVLVHGYNTNHDEARGNAAEFFKKIWQSGCDARFTAVEWRGDESQINLGDLFPGLPTFTPNYYVNVENAFAAARPFADACKKLPGNLVLVGHSLGNVLISSAIKDYGLDYLKFVMLNAAVAREAFDPDAYDVDMVDDDWLGDDQAKVEGEGEDGGALTNHLDWASRWYRNFADKKYDPYEYRRKLAWRGRFANLPRTVNYYSPSDNVLLNPDPHEEDPDKCALDSVNGLFARKVGFGFWAFSEKIKGTWVVDAINEFLTGTFPDFPAMKCEGGWGVNPDYDDEISEFVPANTRFTPFLDERLKEPGMLDILPAETERVRAQHLGDAIPAESFAAGANPVATLENVNMESFIDGNPIWPVHEGEETQTNEWKHSTFREVAFYHTSKLYASLAAVERQRVIVDTDLGSSMDDLFTIDLAARMHKAGKLDLMAVMMDRPDGHDQDGKGEFLTFADRYLASLGLGDLPIGKAMSPEGVDTPQYVFNPYWTLIHSNNLTGVGLLLPTNRTPEQIRFLPSAVALYRRLLNDAPDRSVVICSTGFLSNLRELMESGRDYEGDDIYSTGLELIAAKVKELRIMGGCFDPDSAPDGTGGAEYNFAGDPEAAKKVVEEWPTPVFVSPWEAGLKLEYLPNDVLADFPAGTFDPVVRAAYTYWPEPIGENDKNRLWDPITVLPLTEGETLVPLSEKGGISVDGGGKTTFTPDPSGNRCYQVASNMNETAVLNRLREIYRMGNPSLPDAVRCIKDAGIDYNGHDLTFKVPKFSLGAYDPDDVHLAFAFDDKSYTPDEVTYDPVLEVFSVHFDVPAEDATAWNFYNGTFTITLENEELGTNVIKEVPTQIVQGAIDYNKEECWFSELELEAPTNYVPSTQMPEQTKAIVETTFTFEDPSPETDDPPEDGTQAAVRIVADGKGGYKFQYYAFAYYAFPGSDEGAFCLGWHDFNVGGENVREIKPEIGRSYIVRIEGFYLEDAHNEENTLAFAVKDAWDNRDPVPQFVGNLINKDGGLGGTTRLHSIEFAGEGTVSELRGDYCLNVVNANLARVGVGEGADATREYATVAEAVAAADGQPIRLLHAASWMPTSEDLGKSIRFLNKSSLVLDLSDLPFGMRPVWSGVDGNNGTMMLTQLYGEPKRVAPYLHEIWYEDFLDCPLTGADAPFGERQAQALGGCSSVRVGNYHGRNLDIGISDLATVVIHMSSAEGRFASVGTTQWGDVSETALSANAVSDHRFDVLPNWTLDGINEKGVAINVNIIPMDVPQDGDDPDSDERPAMHARKVVRYVLDHAESAADAVERLQGFRVFGNVGAAQNNVHWMISDAEKTFVVEIIKGEVVAREHPIMTNFNVNWDNGNRRKIDDPENWGPERYFWAAAYSNDTDTIFKTYSPHAEGIERYVRLRDNGEGYLKRGATFEGMFDLMREAQYSRIAYLPLAETYLSDLLDLTEVKDAGFESLADVYAASNAAKLAAAWAVARPAMTNVYENLADYRNPEAIAPYSITTHNVTFDLAKRMFRIAVQEDYDHTFDIWLELQVSPEAPIGPYETAEAASNAMKRAGFAPSEAVAAVLDTDAARRTYRNMFTLEVVPFRTDSGRSRP